MTTHENGSWSKEELWEEHWPEVFPSGPVVVPSGFAQWALRSYPLVGSLGVGKPVIRVGAWLFVFWFAGTGQWWVQRLVLYDPDLLSRA